MTTLPERLLALPELWRTRAARKRECGLVEEALLDDIHASELDSALEAAQALQAAPEGGWVLVPREPTEEMIEAAATAPLQSMQKQRQRLSLGEILKIEYAAMLYAAPSPSAALQAGEARLLVPVEPINEAIRHMTKWLDLNDCECESGHQCGRIEVQRTRDQLRDLTAPIGQEG